MHAFHTISPIDGRYFPTVQDLVHFFSEKALMEYRLMIEVEYLIALSLEPRVSEIKPFSQSLQAHMRTWYEDFSDADAKEVKKIESQTNHDVKAIEYFLQKRLQKTVAQKHIPFVHFALTSEDVNNIAYTLMWADGLEQVYQPALKDVFKEVHVFAKKHAKQSMLSLTHGQSATPTTVGKEFAVFAARLHKQMKKLDTHQFEAKLGGATGNWAAHYVAYPHVNWPTFTKRFLKSLRLEANLLTIQIEPHDSLIDSYQTIQHINAILMDMCRDIWLYVSRGILAQKKKEGEVGSSTMPHKINPIQFENAEGNLGIANAYFAHLSQKLPLSRMQRDLTDSTVLRNQGVPLAHSLLACKNILRGFSRLTIHKEHLEHELERHWEVLAEAIQTILRKNGHKDAYEQLKTLTRGQTMTPESIRSFIATLAIDEDDKATLLRLTPGTYVGASASLVKEI